MGTGIKDSREKAERRANSLLRKKILDASDIKEELVHVSEWDVELLVRGMSGRERADLINSVMKRDGQPDWNKLFPEILIATCYDPETQEHVFEREDRDMLNLKASSVLQHVGNIAMRLSGMDQLAQDQAAKN